MFPKIKVVSKVFEMFLHKSVSIITVMARQGVNKSGMGGGVLSIETLFDYWRSTSVVRPL